MDATTRTAAVLAAAALLVVPLVNALVLESQRTADRQVVDPPDQPPPDAQTSPSQVENASRDLPENRAVTAGNCTPVPEETPAARWHHPSPASRPGAAAQTRAQAPDERTFRVSDLHPAVRVQLNVTNLVGSLQATVHPAGAPDDPAWSADLQRGFPDDVAEGATLTRAGDLATGGWVATLETGGATYGELAYTVVRAICEEAEP